MLVLAFRVGGRLYGLDVARVRSVLPRVALRPLDGTPAWVAGVLQTPEGLVPVVDLCRLQSGQPCRPAYASRIVVVDYVACGQPGRALGLVVEGVTDTVPIDPATLSDTGISVDDMPWLGRMTSADGVLLQLVSVDDLLAPEVRERLFP